MGRLRSPSVRSSLSFMDDVARLRQMADEIREIRTRRCEPLDRGNLTHSCCGGIAYRFDGYCSARRGTYRINEAKRVTEIPSIHHRRDAYRS